MINAPDALKKLIDISFRQLPAPEGLRSHPVDRRNMAVRLGLLTRIYREFDEMPGTALTQAQATRLFGMTDEICGRVLRRLVRDGQLRQTPDGRFRLPSAAA